MSRYDGPLEAPPPASLLRSSPLEVSDLDRSQTAAQEIGSDPMQSLSFLEDLAEQFVREGKDVEALNVREEALMIRMETYGSLAPETVKACVGYALMCNSLAVKYLRLNDFQHSFELLGKTDNLTSPTSGFMPSSAGEDSARLKCRAITLNNYACYYRERGKLRAALVYLDETLFLEEQLERVGQADVLKKMGFKVEDHHHASTHLNLCAILSQMGRHHDALVHAAKALSFLVGAKVYERNAAGDLVTTVPSTLQLGQMPADVCSLLCAAFHNLAVEHEFIGKLVAARDLYQFAAEAAEVSMGRDHPVAVQMFALFWQLSERLQGSSRATEEMQRKPQGPERGPTSSRSAVAGRRQ